MNTRLKTARASMVTGMEGRVPFDHLADHVQRQIFEYLQIGDRIVAERVCKEWKALASEVNEKQTAFVLLAEERSGMVVDNEKQLRECDDTNHFIPQNSIVKQQVRNAKDVASILRRLPGLKVFLWDNSYPVPGPPLAPGQDPAGPSFRNIGHESESEDPIYLPKSFKSGDDKKIYADIGKALKKNCPLLEHVFLWGTSVNDQINFYDDHALYREIASKKITCISSSTCNYPIRFFPKLKFAKLSLEEKRCTIGMTSIMRKGLEGMVIVADSFSFYPDETVDYFIYSKKLRYGELRMPRDIYDDLREENASYVKKVPKKNKTIQRFTVTAFDPIVREEWEYDWGGSDPNSESDWETEEEEESNL